MALVSAVLLLLTSAEATEPAAGADIAGVYAAAGTNGDGSPYHAIVVIAEHEDAFRLQWIFPSRNAVAGLGVLGGDLLAVSYVGSPPGIVLYQVEGDRLVGRWTMLGSGGYVATETLTPCGSTRCRFLPGSRSAHRASPL